MLLRCYLMYNHAEVVLAFKIFSLTYRIVPCLSMVLSLEQITCRKPPWPNWLGCYFPVIMIAGSSPAGGYYIQNLFFSCVSLLKRHIF